MKNVFYNSWVAKTALCLSKCHTIILFGFVFSKLKEEEMTQRVRNHECVHARQWFEVTALIGSILLLVVLSFGVSAWWLLLSGNYPIVIWWSFLCMIFYLQFGKWCWWLEVGVIGGMLSALIC